MKEDTDLSSCVKREVGLGPHSLSGILSTSLINRALSVDVNTMKEEEEEAATCSVNLE